MRSRNWNAACLSSVAATCPWLTAQIVHFRVQDRFFFAANRAVVTLQHALTRDASLEQQLAARGWLFPDVADLQASERAIDNATIEWHDPSLNAEQRVRSRPRGSRSAAQQAVEQLVFYHRRIPFLISGPPGTGKTRTLVEAVLQILRLQPAARLLVVGASQSSADTIAERIVRLGAISPAELFRASVSLAAELMAQVSITARDRSAKSDLRYSLTATSAAILASSCRRIRAPESSGAPLIS